VIEDVTGYFGRRRRKKRRYCGQTTIVGKTAPVLVVFRLVDEGQFFRYWQESHTHRKNT